MKKGRTYQLPTRTLSNMFADPLGHSHTKKYLNPPEVGKSNQNWSNRPGPDVHPIPLVLHHILDTEVSRNLRDRPWGRTN